MIDRLAEMRVHEFCDFPYLYSGNVQDDLYYYCSGYSKEPNSLLILALNEENVVGICSGLPFSGDMPFIQDWVSQAKTQGIDLSQSYYLGELIVLPEFRKMGIAKKILAQFFEEVNNKDYREVALVTAIRSATHALRPNDYEDTDQVRSKAGFDKSHATLSIEYPTYQCNNTVKNEINMRCYGKRNSEAHPPFSGLNSEGYLFSTFAHSSALG